MGTGFSWKGMPLPGDFYNSKELQPIAVCAVGEMNTGEQEWGAFATAPHGMTENLVDM